MRHSPFYYMRHSPYLPCNLSLFLSCSHFLLRHSSFFLLRHLFASLILYLPLSFICVTHSIVYCFIQTLLQRHTCFIFLSFASLYAFQWRHSDHSSQTSVTYFFSHLSNPHFSELHASLILLLQMSLLFLLSASHIRVTRAFFYRFFFDKNTTYFTSVKKSV